MAREIIKYNNKMNNIPLKNFEKNDLNFFYAICSKVKNHGSEKLEISFDEIKELTNYNQSKDRFIADLDRMNGKLMSCSGRFETEDEIVRFNLFSTFRIIKSRKVLKVGVNEDFTWLLNNIAKEFTSFELQEYVSLDGIYAKALYRLLKQWKTQGKTPKYGVTELKELLSTPDYAPKDVMKEVINPAVEEIKSSGAFENLWCEVVYARKRGKPVDGYIFHFSADDLKGQITFKDVEEFDEITKGMSAKEKKAIVATANNIVKAKKKGINKKKNSFVDSCSHRQASTKEREERYQLLLEKTLLGVKLTSEENAEFEELSAERR
jgi:plasmid replication initiation protein